MSFGVWGEELEQRVCSATEVERVVPKERVDTPAIVARAGPALCAGQSL